MSFCQYDSNITCPYDSYRVPTRSAIAVIKGSAQYPDINGTVYFERAPKGTNVMVRLSGLPEYKMATATSPQIGPHGFHIHSGGSCVAGPATNPFPNTDGHFNPTNQPHGNQSGDFSAIFSNHGVSRISFYTDKFFPEDIIGKTVVIHLSPDDYKTQPAGGSGLQIACGVIKKA
ncbi:MAG TPA: superoxide dismutase family protein [Clostridiaceae bacterium]